MNSWIPERNYNKKANFVMVAPLQTLFIMAMQLIIFNTMLFRRSQRYFIRSFSLQNHLSNDKEDYTTAALSQIPAYFVRSFSLQNHLSNDKEGYTTAALSQISAYFVRSFSLQNHLSNNKEGYTTAALRMCCYCNNVYLIQ